MSERDSDTALVLSKVCLRTAASPHDREDSPAINWRGSPPMASGWCGTRTHHLFGKWQRAGGPGITVELTFDGAGDWVNRRIWLVAANVAHQRDGRLVSQRVLCAAREQHDSPAAPHRQYGAECLQGDVRQQHVQPTDR